MFFIVDGVLSRSAKKARGYFKFRAETNFFLIEFGMARVETPQDVRLVKALQNLERKKGLRRELLPSKMTNLKVLRKLSENRKVVQHFALNWCVTRKFRKAELIPKSKRWI